MKTDGKAVRAPRPEPGVAICNAASQPLLRHRRARLRIADKRRDEPAAATNGRFVTHHQSHISPIDANGQIVLQKPFRNGDTDARPQPRGQMQ